MLDNYHELMNSIHCIVSTLYENIDAIIINILMIIAGLHMIVDDTKSAGNKVNLGFRNIKQSSLNVLKAGTPYTATPQTFTCNGDKCCADNSYWHKLAEYIQVSLLFPIQMVQVNDFTNELQKSCDDKEVVHITTANTLALKHCDALFEVFLNGESSRTYFENLFIIYQFNINGKLYPHERCDSYEDPWCLSNTLNVLNIFKKKQDDNEELSCNVAKH